MKKIKQIGILFFYYNSIAIRKAKRVLIFSIFFICSVIGMGLKAQTASDYVFSTATTASLTDMSSGTSSLIATGTYRDDYASAVTNMGFTFYFMGTAYTQFSINSNGQMRLGSTQIAGTAVTPASSIPYIIPINGDNSMQSTGKVHYKLTGSSGSYCLVVEWVDIRVPYASETGYTYCNFQVRLYETSNIIEFVYGTMYNRSTSSQSRYASISSSNTSGTIGAVEAINTTPVYNSTTTSPTASSFAASSNMTNLNSAAQGSRRIFMFTPPTCFKPATVTSTAVTSNTATISWTAASPAPTNGYEYEVRTSGTAGSGSTGLAVSGSTIAGDVNDNISGLISSTTYYVYVRSNCGGSDYSAWTSSYSFTTSATPSVFINATSGTAYGEFLTLKAAFDAINAGTHKGVIAITIGNSNGQTITETAQAVLNKSGSGSASYTGISINPAYANITIGASFAGACCSPTAIIQLNAAENVTIDGRINSSGSTFDLTIENTNSTASNYASALYFNGASNNIVRYCNIKSSSTCTSSGVGTVSFSYNSTTTTGCTNNTIEYCNITKSGANWPMVAIASSNSSSTKKSQFNIVRYCAISDFKRYGIWLGNSGIADYNESWTINNNTIYESSNFAIDASVYANHGIYIGYHANGTFTSSYQSGNVVISDNVIGGNGSGGSWTVTGSGSSNFVSGIYVAANTTTYSEINGNTIQNFDVETQYFAGICADKTKLKIGSTSGNTISSIVLKHPAAAGGTVAGIYINSNADYSNEIKNNSVNFSTTTGNNYTNLYGLLNTCSTTHPKDVVSSNVISNIDATKANTAYGIYAQGYISQNHISKIKYSGSNPLYGIYWMGGRATGLDYRVENNEVILGIDNSGSSTSINTDIYGIFSTRSEINLFYNSVLLQGVATTKNSYCLRLNANTTGYVIKNNLLYNERSGGSGSHYCISTAFTTTSYWDSSNNAYVLYSGSKAVYYLGDWGGTGKTTLTDWTTASAETNSISETSTNKPVANLLPNVSGSNNLLPFNDKWLCAGCVVSPSTDFINISRHNPGPTTIGAYELDCPVLLPIDLLTFSCITFENKKVLLQWSTASEVNNDFFTIERSYDCKTFNAIGIIPGAGNSNSTLSYQTTDKNPFSGVNYYRLKQTDFDGTSTYSKIISTDITDLDLNISIFPNPFSEYLEINFNDKEVSDIDVSVINEVGQEISMTFFKSEINKVRISFPRDIPQGNYYIKVKSLNQCRYYKTVKI